ncbi:DgyrCDS14511 [Dimorphilus gyrociliatus]|uniref:DgyrCDS14511 n=1 Tax=Dimorphilus gyrociliatus TaxID=2664684 RepID=A0A7I8WDW1_9ANNE|nr:DgyrCDS14511 [Dimorphilus gyrociliatus]
MLPYCFGCKKKINKLKQGVCSLCHHKVHWACLSDGLCSICSSVDKKRIRIILSKCDEILQDKSTNKVSNAENIDLNHSREEIDVQNIIMDVDHEEVVTLIETLNCDAEYRLVDNLSESSPLHGNILHLNENDINMEESFESIPEVNYDSNGTKKIVMDFEKAVWKAVLNNWENVNLSGCLFHWNQAVYRKIQELGYSSDFNKKNGQWFEMRQLMALPFLPSHIIPIEFIKNKDYLKSIDKLADFIDYFERTWILNDVWSPKCWSIYQCAIRTNNDVEGFHNRLNGNVGVNVSFYSVIDELKREADLIAAYQRMLSEKKILRYQRKFYKNLQNKIFSIWERFEKHEITSSEVLVKCSELYLVAQ